METKNGSRRTDIDIYPASFEEGKKIKEKISSILSAAGLLDKTVKSTIMHCCPERCTISPIFDPYVNIGDTNGERLPKIVVALKKGNLKMATKIYLIPRAFSAEEMVDSTKESAE